MNIRIVNLVAGVVLFFLLASCASPKNIAYLQTLENTKKVADQGTSDGLYEAHLKPKDLLNITVVTSEPNASRIYNLIMPQLSDVTNASFFTTPTAQAYMVDNEGNIDFPVLGKIYVARLTRKELEAKIQKGLEPAFSKERPIITIRITNYSVNILGEVTRSGRYLSMNDRLTIFEGLAMAGDLTIYGRRNNVKVLRENADGSKTLMVVNLNDKNIVDSPAYYLEQNDVVYVEPNKSRSRASNISSAETLSVSALSIVISLASLVINILR